LNTNQSAHCCCLFNQFDVIFSQSSGFDDRYFQIFAMKNQNNKNNQLVVVALE